MKFKKLGGTDLKVSLICLGTMTWGEQNTENEAFEQMDYSLEKGVNFFDTAEYYSVKGKEKTYLKEIERFKEATGNNMQKCIAGIFI